MTKKLTDDQKAANKAKKQAELQAMEDSIMGTLANIAGKPVTVQFANDTEVISEIKPSAELLAEYAAKGTEPSKIETISEEKQGLVTNSVLIRIGFGAVHANRD